jgi:hypothetical protein
MTKTVVQASFPDDVTEMERLIEEAKVNKVAEQYTNSGGILSGKMGGNIKARDIYDMLAEYP